MADPKDALYVPGMWRCGKCQFVLIQSNLNANTGAVTARDQPGEKCPNCDVCLWRLSWREHAEDMAERCEEQVMRAVAAEERIKALEADAARYRWLREHADVLLDEAVWYTTDSGHRINVAAPARSELDRAIDAARKETDHG